MSDTRSRIAETVRTNPGLHFSEIVDHLDLAPGQVQYHVRRLADSGDVVADSLGGRTHYFPPSYAAWERRALALLRRETAGDVVALLLEAERARPETVAEELGIARSTLEWQLDRLVAADLVAKRRDGRRVFLEPKRPDETLRLLREADPDLGQRLVDRFIRLADRLFEE